MDEEFLPCPFCGGEVPKDLSDTLHPSGVYRRPDPDIGGHYIRHEDRQAGDQPCWKMNCTENMGGCGASIHADSREEVIAKWNRRTGRLPHGAERDDLVITLTQGGKTVQEYIDRIIIDHAGDKEGMIESYAVGMYERLNRDE